MSERCLVMVTAYFVQPGEYVNDDKYVVGEVDADGKAISECAIFSLTHFGESVGGFPSALDYFEHECGLSSKETAQEVERWYREALRLRNDPHADPIFFTLAYDFWSEELDTDVGREYDCGINFAGVVDWDRLIATLPLRPQADYPPSSGSSVSPSTLRLKTNG